MTAALILPITRMQSGSHKKRSHWLLFLLSNLSYYRLVVPVPVPAGVVVPVGAVVPVPVPVAGVVVPVPVPVAGVVFAAGASHF